METVLFLHPLLDLLIGCFALRRFDVHLIQIDLHTDMVLDLRKFGQKTYRFDVAGENDFT